MHSSCRRSVVFVLASLGACHQPPTHIELRDDSAWKGLPVEAVVDGRVVAKEEAGHISRIDVPSLRASVVMRFQLPCGTHDYPVQVEQTETGKAIHSASGVVAIPASYEHSAEIPTWVNVTIDNRDRPATTMSFGSMTLNVPTGAYQVTVPGPSCSGVELRLGKDVLARFQSVDELPGDILIDASGTHCYRSRRVHYGVSDLTAGMGLGPTGPVFHRGARLFPNVSVSGDTLFKPAPEKVETTSFAGVTADTDRYELLDCTADELKQVAP